MLPYEFAIQHGSASRPFDHLELWGYRPPTAPNIGHGVLYEDDGISKDYLTKNSSIMLSVSVFHDEVTLCATWNLSLSTFSRPFANMPFNRYLLLRVPDIFGVQPMTVPQHVLVNGVEIAPALSFRYRGSRYIGGPGLAISLPAQPYMQRVTIVNVCD